MSTERQNCRDGERKTFTFSKTGTLPTLERLLGEMAALEEQTQELEKRKEEMKVLIELNKKLKARNHFLERENNTLKLDKGTHSTRSFDYPVTGVVKSDESSNVELMVLNRRHPAHYDDRLSVKLVTGFIFMLLPTMLGVGVWAGCMLHTSKVWYEVQLDSPIKLPFYIFGGVWCGIYGTLGLGVYSSWYQMGGRRGVAYILLGTAALLVSFSYPPVLLIGHWILPSFALIGALWLLTVSCLMCFSRLSVMTGLCIIPALFWTTYTLLFTFFPFYDDYFGEKS